MPPPGPPRPAAPPRDAVTSGARRGNGAHSASACQPRGPPGGPRAAGRGQGAACKGRRAGCKVRRATQRATSRVRRVQCARCGMPCVRECACHAQSVACRVWRATCCVRRVQCARCAVLGVQGAACHVQEAACKVQRARCSMLHAWCDVPGATCKVQCAACYMQGAACHMPHAGCSVQGATCKVQRATCKVQHAACKVQGAVCSVPHARCSVPRARCRVQRARVQHAARQGGLAQSVWLPTATGAPCVCQGGGCRGTPASEAPHWHPCLARSQGALAHLGSALGVLGGCHQLRRVPMCPPPCNRVNLWGAGFARAVMGGGEEGRYGRNVWKGREGLERCVGRGRAARTVRSRCRWGIPKMSPPAPPVLPCLRPNPRPVPCSQILPFPCDSSLLLPSILHMANPQPQPQLLQLFGEKKFSLPATALPPFLGDSCFHRDGTSRQPNSLH
ncbi:fibrillin-2-like isoform X3 [Falco naumanni]|uniref:fibrillin-2-like isoform X3 n=1 Tax=Falco naumanni TaxID=148594 RepID=UPI001ADE8ED0|nr:fibrillin-2-like isoform X3 [Falco naumanni]